MERGVVVRGRLHGRHIDLDESVDQREVEIVVRAVEPARTTPVEPPPGTRTKDDIDRQIAEERDSWGDR